MNRNWELKTLKDVCDNIFAGGDLPKNNFSKFKTNIYNIPIFANGAKDKGLYGFTDIKKVIHPSITVSARGTIGYSEIRNEPFFPIVRLIVLIPNRNIISLEFLKYIIDNMEFKNTGTSIPQLTIPMIAKYKSFIPLLEEQKQIVEILDKAFESIEQAKVNIEKNIENTKELFQSRLNEIFSQKGDGWEEKELIEINKFIDYRGKTPKKTESGIRLITAKNVKMGVLNREPEEYIDTNDYEDWMTRGIPQKGDVLFTTEAPLAMVALLDTDEKIALAQRIITLCPNREILSGEYLSYCMQSNIVQNRILEKGTGATVTGIKSKLLKEILIPIPKDKNTQKLIVDEIDILKEQTKQLEKHYKQKLKNLEELKKSILQKAFSGELLK
jgi:type I restriction enzyme S subunit